MRDGELGMTDPEVPTVRQVADIMVSVEGSEPPLRLPMSKELAIELAEWSEPVQVQVYRPRDGGWMMTFRRVPKS